MTTKNRLCAALALLATLLAPPASRAEIFRAYLAFDGNDANPCTLQLPCRLLPAALAAVASGGEIWLLDSANYNTATVDVTKSVFILAVPGAVGSVVAAGGPAISIATGGVKVSLRNLVIVPLPGAGGIGGISMTQGVALNVEHCLIANVAGPGIEVATAAEVRISDTTIRGATGNGVLLRAGAKGVVTRALVGDVGGIGLYANGSTPNTTTTLDIISSTIETSVHGVSAFSDNASGVVKLSVSDSLIARNANQGISVYSTQGATVSVAVTNNRISNNGTVGIISSGLGTKVWVSANTIANNGTGMLDTLALLESAGNNAIRNNGTDISGNIGVVPLK